MVRLPITPDNIFLAENGRWTWCGVDVTDHPFWWKCADCGLSYEETIAVKIAASDCGRVACPACKVKAALCSVSGCWEATRAECECECGAVTKICRQHVDFMSDELSHCGPAALTTVTLLLGA